MSYKYSRGAQVIGDLKAADDTERDTLIDFGEDVIDFQTSGSSVLKISGSEVYLNDGSNIHLGTDSFIFFDGYDTTSDCYITQHPDNSLFIDGNNFVRIIGDQGVIVQHNTTQKVNFDFDNNVVSVSMPLSSSQDISGSKLHLQGGITNGGQTFLDSQGNLAAADANLSDVTSSNLSFSGDLFLNNTEKLIDSQGDHSLLQTMVVELSIPGTDVQTDSSAFRFFCPYDLTVDELQLNLDENVSGERVTVQISGSQGFTQSLTLIGPTDNGSTGSLDGSLQAGELLNFEITNVTGTPQGLIANLLYRRTLP